MQPITGILRKRATRDIIGGVGTGLIASYAYWYGFHVPQMNRYKEYDDKVKVAVEKVHSEYYASLKAE
jgi:cytochrome c oxidase subunit 7